MDNLYDIIKGPIFTEKGTYLKESENKHLIEVADWANKIEIKKAFETIFNVKVAKIATLKKRGKLQRFGRSTGMAPDRKKALVTLKEGETLDFIEGV